ncbi:hypothetical protein FHS83_000633 [Rhizomicrobium palustre]|uniref:Uncharacterized protein n=1 Tax=Rhizomicrobium palustre TaxID=189966 RepID=A0A846MVR7_9PROT|nr:hypothetical protein [Rhizomicrobium palustre]NIK87315.1 hypothetical protein [Rhizomicrobium palustre]
MFCPASEGVAVVFEALAGAEGCDEISAKSACFVGAAVRFAGKKGFEMVALMVMTLSGQM